METLYKIRDTLIKAGQVALRYLERALFYVQQWVRKQFHRLGLFLIRKGLNPRRVYLLAGALIAAVILIIVGISAFTGRSKDKGGETQETAAAAAEDGESANKKAKTQFEPIEEPIPGWSKSGAGVYNNVWTFYDAAGNRFRAALFKQATPNRYDTSKFARDGLKASYEDAQHTSRLGVDVSAYNGDIDWKKLKKQGIEFAFIRLGYRGYTEGGLNLDATFEQNMKAAKKAGVQIGVYFFSQAVNEAEAEEEAQFCIDKLKSYSIDLPVVFDPEYIDGAENARTNGLGGEQFTQNALVFAEKIKSAGYTPMIYANCYWEAYVLNMAELNDLGIWFADYSASPQSPYRYSVWQYSYQGTLEGIPEGTTVDLDLMIVPKK